MKIEKIFRKIPIFKNITLDKILFESKYPVLFTCKNDNDIYLFICCLVNAVEAKWIGTKTNYDTLIELLENKITIQNAFLSVTEEKVIIEYNGQNVICNMVEKNNIQDRLLPTAGEYMDADDDEFAEEIAVFKLRNKNMEFRIQPRISSLLMLNYSVKRVTLTDEYFNLDLGVTDEMKFTIGKTQEQMVALA